MELLTILLKGVAGGIAALGFAIMFNSTQRTLASIFLLGMLGILLKLFAASLHFNIVLATFIGAASVGILSQLVSYLKKTPVLVVSIPAVIPMIPGKYIYHTMIGMVGMIGDVEDDKFWGLLRETISNGLNATFILLVLSLGISLPYLIMRKQSVNYFKGFSLKDES